MRPEPYPSLQSIYDYDIKIRETITKYFAMVIEKRINAPAFMSVEGLTTEDVEKERDKLLKEEEFRTCFALLAYIEATFKAHFLHVVDSQPQSVFYNSFQNLHNSRVQGNTNDLHRISLKADILSEWLQQNKIPQQLHDDIVNAFKLRNWIAHGQYFTNTADPKYSDYVTLYVLADDVRQLCLQEGAGAYMS